MKKNVIKHETDLMKYFIFIMTGLRTGREVGMEAEKMNYIGENLFF